MPQSMTGFARLEQQNALGFWSWELRSVNSRYLDLHLRLPEELRDLEMKVREILRKRLSRGKVECTLKFTRNVAEQGLNVNSERVDQVLAALQQVEMQMGPGQATNPIDILRWPGVLDTAEVDLTETKALMLEQFDLTIDQLIEMRRREGSALSEQVLGRLEKIDAIVTEVKGLLPSILEHQRNHLKHKFEELHLELDADRLEQEMVLLAQKADVAEELDRLNVHTQEIRRILQQSEPVGRRLDFMMQELNREANTLSSKSIVTDTTQAAVELKVIIEQMREQIQNIE